MQTIAYTFSLACLHVYVRTNVLVHSRWCHLDVVLHDFLKELNGCFTVVVVVCDVDNWGVRVGGVVGGSGHGQ
jgi:hypothetical protein